MPRVAIGDEGPAPEDDGDQQEGVREHGRVFVGAGRLGPATALAGSRIFGCDPDPGGTFRRQESPMAGKKKSSAPPRQILLEEMRSQNRATLEAVEASRIALEQRLDRLDRESRERDSDLAAAIRENRAAIQGNRSAIQQNTASIQQLQSETRALTLRVESLARIEERVAALEKRLA
jgi:hypothetical protein